jgi:uncharacterized membrane protein YgdD (TMEM256/DUF423 family)
MYKPALTTGALLAALAVILGAFGAHSLKNHLEHSGIELADIQRTLQTFDTGVRYQFYHCFALLAVGLIYASYPSKSLRWATAMFTIGIVLFSGSLYAITLLKLQGGAGLGPIGILTPIGGLFFIAGWIGLFLGISRSKSSASIR